MPQLNLLHMDSEEKQDDAMEVNNDGVDVDASSPETNKEPDSDCVVPVTPDAVRENGDIQVQSPLTLTVVRKQLKLACIDSDDSVSGSSNGSGSGSPRTPEHGVFNPFAPGPDHMAWAPRCNKYLHESRNTVARHLDFPLQNPLFHDAAESESLSDEDVFRSLYESLFQLIVSVQIPNSSVEYDSDDCKTPPFPLPLTGIADTCPGAPLKPAGWPLGVSNGVASLSPSF